MKRLISLFLTLALSVSSGTAAFAAYTMEELAAFGHGGYTDNEIINNEISQMIAAQSCVLLENNGVLPIEKNGSIALFGNAVTATVKGGTGSGVANQRERDWIDTAFEDAGFTITTPEEYLRKIGRGVVATAFINEGSLPEDVAITDQWLTEASGTDTAVYCIARSSGEGADRTATKGDYYLTDIERRNIEMIAAAFENVIIVLNTQVIDVSWIREIENIDAVLYIGYGGQRAGAACVQVLTGDITPSGKTSCTWAFDINDYASSQAGFSSFDHNTDTEYYSDGIYVGYRYFDTFGLDVAYPFGYGLSYTDFTIVPDSVTADADNVTVTATVTNTGADYSGKEVVQVYYSAPDGTLEKPYQELGAYAKTDELAPGESQTLTISYKTSDMSSYSEELEAYIMEAGEYIIRVGNSSRNTHVAAVAVLDEDCVTEQLSNQFPLEDGAVLEELSKAGISPISYEGEGREIQAAERIVLDSVTYLGDNASPYDEETVTTYLFAQDAEDYDAHTRYLRTKTVSGIIQNNSGKGGYQATSYDEVVEIVPDLPEGITKDTAKLTDVITGAITLEQFVACLSANEMAKLVNGGSTTAVGTIIDEDGSYIAYSHAMVGGIGRTTTKLFESRYIPVLEHSDGPAGIRSDQDGVTCPEINDDNKTGGTYYLSTNGVSVENNNPDAQAYYIYPTAFPTGSNIANTWDVDLARAYGEAVGAELSEYGVAAWLAPGMNIVRNPLGGRSFEYYSEDPVLTGITAANVIAGVQSHHGVGLTPKHFFANNQENNRNALNNVIGERAAREIYLKGFELAVKQAQPMFLMTCYNENNGWPGADNRDVITDVLRGEWGFKGYVMTDWGGGQSSPCISMHAGNDMIMWGYSPKYITNYLTVTEPDFEDDGFVHTETYTTFMGTQTIESWGSFVPDAEGEETAIAPVSDYSALSETVRDAISKGIAEFIEDTDGSYVLWHGCNIGICLGDLQQAALHILHVMLYAKDMQTLCDDLDAGLGLGINYSGTQYGLNYSDAMLAQK